MYVHQDVKYSQWAPEIQLWQTALPPWMSPGPWADCEGPSESAQSLNHVRLFSTPGTAAGQASLSITNSQSLLKLMSIESVIPSNHLILCHTLLLPSIFSSIRVFSNESVRGPACALIMTLWLPEGKKIFPIFWRYMPGFTEIKNLPTMQETQVWSLGWEKIPWRRKWQPASVFLPGRVHGQRSLVGYSPWGHKESDTTEHTCWHIYRCNDILRSGWETRGQDLLQWVSHLYQVATPHPTWRGAGRPIWLLVTATPEDQQGGKHTRFSAICFGPYFGSHSWPPLSSLLDFEDTDTIQTTKLFLAAFISNEGQPPGWWLRMQDVRGWDQPHRHVLKQL